jgi:hypothetical protein
MQQAPSSWRASKVESSSGGRSPITWPLVAAVVVVASAAGSGCGVFCPLCPHVDLWAVGPGLRLELELELFWSEGTCCSCSCSRLLCGPARSNTSGAAVALLSARPDSNARCPVRDPGPGPAPRTCAVRCLPPDGKQRTTRANAAFSR